VDGEGSVLRTEAGGQKLCLGDYRALRYGLSALDPYGFLDWA